MRGAVNHEGRPDPSVWVDPGDSISFLDPGPGLDSGDGPEADPRAVLARLRERVRAIERRGAATAERVLPFGLDAVDGALPGGGLALGRVHEITGPPRSEVRDAAPFGFAVAVLARLLAAVDAPGRERAEGREGADGRPILWCARASRLRAGAFGGALSGRGLASLGLDPGRLILVETPAEAHGGTRGGPRGEILGEVASLDVAEQALRTDGLAAVVLELGPSRSHRAEAEAVAGRRLQLAAERTGVTGLLLRPDPGRLASSLPVETRWRVSAAHGAIDDWRPRWHLELTRVRGAATPEAGWTVLWDAGTGRFANPAQRHGVADDVDARRPTGPAGSTGSAGRFRSTPVVDADHEATRVA